jgi:hypothetical protein
MNPMKWHPMTMDPMIFELKPGVHAASLYLIICSYLDEGVKATLDQTLNAWNGTKADLVQAFGELCDLHVLRPMEPLQYDKELVLNRRESWAWCSGANHCFKKAM